MRADAGGGPAGRRDGIHRRLAALVFGADELMHQMRVRPAMAATLQEGKMRSALMGRGAGVGAIGAGRRSARSGISVRVEVMGRPRPARSFFKVKT